MNINIVGIANTFVHELIDVANDLGINYFLVNNGYKIIDDFNFIELEHCDHLLPTVIGLGTPENRESLFKVCQLNGFDSWYTLKAPDSHVAESASVGEGVFLNHGAVVGGKSIIGNHCVVNRLAGVGHHVEVGDFSFIGPGVQVLGSTKIEPRVFIGANSTILNGVSIGEGALIGAGSIVTKDVLPNSVAYGSPAKFIKFKD